MVEVSAQRSLAVTESSQAGEVRRLAKHLAEDAGYDDVDAGNAAIVASEIASNLVKHARDGRIVLFTSETGGTPSLNLLAIDRGPGIDELARSSRDGMSTAGTPGTGLGAIRRLATTCEIFSTASGTALFAAVQPRRAAASSATTRVGMVSVPKPGETECGDGFAVDASGSRVAVLVVDGLGHGAGAAAASREALAIFRAEPTRPPAEQLRHIHDALRATRGAAGAVAHLDLVDRTVRFAGIGNIAGTIVEAGATRSTVSHHGTLGHAVRRIDEFTYPWPSGALVILHSDGLTSRWTLDGYPGLGRHHPMLAAGILYRDFCRGSDDATVVVVGDA